MPKGYALVPMKGRRSKTPYRTKRHTRVPQTGRTRTSGYYGRFGPGRPEQKFLDTIITTTDIPLAGKIYKDSFCLVGIGTGESQRIGRKLTLKKISMHVELKLPSATAAAETCDVVRLILIHDKQANGAVITAVTDVLESAGYLSFRNLANSKRFHILWDKTVQLENKGYGGSTVASTCTTKHLHFSKRLNLPLEYDSTGSTIAAIKSNNIAMIVIAELNNIVGIISHTRIRFTDN